MKKITLLLSLLFVTAPPVYAADGRVNPYGSPNRQVNTHVGQMDTDGYLSPGELRNPRINYNDGSFYRTYPQSSWYYDQQIKELERRERELAYQEEQARRYDYERPWWRW